MTSFLDKMALRRLADAAARRYARWRVGQLDRQRTDQVQRQTLLQLVRRARHTAFGRNHGFGTIRGVRDYQLRVPLRDYEAFWNEYWCGPFPHVQGITWPGRIPYFALSSGTTSGTTKYIPVSREMLAANQRAGLTALSLFLATRPAVPLLTGRLFFLGGSTDLVELRPQASPTHAATGNTRVLGGDLSGIMSCEASSLLRAFAFPPTELAFLSDWDRKLDLLADKACRLPITMLSGVPSWILVLFERLKKISGRDKVTDVWPELRLVIHGGTRFDPYRAVFRRELGDDVYLLDTYPASEGYIATEDPRYGLLRPLPDLGVFFEFVPVDELNAERPTRHTIGCVEPGVHYAVVLTTCAGLWSYVLGDTVCFERRDPPLMRFTGRTRQFLSAFGEHLIGEEVEKAVAIAADACGALVIDFHVGPVFPDAPTAPGRHRFFVEFAGPAPDANRFACGVDGVLCRINEDYRAHRRGDLALLPPDIRVVPPGGFSDWMRSRGKLGGQHKVPRLDNTGQLTSDLDSFLSRRG
jgi:hypothetical protein